MESTLALAESGVARAFAYVLALTSPHEISLYALRFASDTTSTAHGPPGKRGDLRRYEKSLVTSFTVSSHGWGIWHVHPSGKFIAALVGR